MASGSFTLDDAHVAILVFGGFMVAVYHTSEPGKASFRAGVAALLWQAFGVVCASGLPPGPGVMLHAKRATSAMKSGRRCGPDGRENVAVLFCRALAWGGNTRERAMLLEHTHERLSLKERQI